MFIGTTRENSYSEAKPKKLAQEEVRTDQRRLSSQSSSSTRSSNSSDSESDNSETNVLNKPISNKRGSKQVEALLSIKKKSKTTQLPKIDTAYARITKAEYSFALGLNHLILYLS